MRKFMLFGALGAVSLTIAACQQRDAAGNDPDNVVTAENAATTGDVTGPDGSATASTGWPEGSRIVVEQGVTYRVMPDGVRVRLGPGDSRIEVVNGTRYRVDPGGTRVRIDERGAPIITTDVDAVGANVNAGMNVGGDTSVGVVTNTP